VAVTGTITGIAAGQMLVLRPNPALALQTETPFLWPLTQYKYGPTLATALTNPQTRLESGTTLELDHKFESDDGSKRSGGFDPASLIRTTGMYMFKTKQYFDNPDQQKNWLAINKLSAAAQSTSGPYGLLQIGMDNFKINKIGMSTAFGQTIYQDLEYGPQYDVTDGTGMVITLVNDKATM
jgi:hypothetical protein